MKQPDIEFASLVGPAGDVGLISLNRPQFLNALTQEMCSAIDSTLFHWENAQNIKAVIIRSLSDRAFCAGGDIRSLYTLREQPMPMQPFFWHEYKMNARIYHFKKPYIALLDGLTMGGGAGISVHGSVRVASEKVKFAMPETGIGFFPDVGASYFLPRCPGKMGWYLGLTGQVINAADMQALGLADHYVPSAKMPDLIDALVECNWSDNVHEAANRVIKKFSLRSEISQLASHQACIDFCFEQPNIETILSRLDQQNASWAKAVADILLMRSPTSLKVVCEQLQRGAHLNFDACMQMEYRMALRFLRAHDFFEGVRAAVIDKDRSPRWKPADLLEISANDILAYFAPLDPEKELVTH